MKSKLTLICLFIAYGVFSQNNKIRKYLLISKNNDTTAVYGKKQSIEDLQNGFRIFDKNGKRTKHKITPDMDIKYLSFIEKNDTITLKSLRSIKHPTFYPYRNAFMLIFIDNSLEELKKGKINLYMHNYDMYSQMLGSYTVSIIYFQDIKGMHQINYKYQYKKYPKLLGKNRWIAMKRYRKGELQFLIDHFTFYNNKIENKKKEPQNSNKN